VKLIPIYLTAILLLLLRGESSNLFGQSQLANMGSSYRYVPVEFESSFPDNLLQTDYVIIGNIEFEGNDATQQHILTRELTLESGDTIYKSNLPKVLEQSRENLMNTSLFNFVNVSLLFHDLLPLANVKFTFVERWYIWPFPIFEVAERNLNDWALNPSFTRTNYGVYIVKENFRGRMERISLLARAGYRQNYSIGYTVPYLNPSQTMGFSLRVGMNLSNEIDYLTRDNTQLFYSEDGSFALKQYYIQSNLFYRKGIHQTHTFSAHYNRSRMPSSA